MNLRSFIPYVVVLFLLLAVVATLGGTKVLQIRALIEAAESTAEPPETVATFTAVEDHWERTLRAIGSVAAVRGVMLSADLPGVVRSISFESGEMVQQGDVLLRLDVSVEEAELESATASVDLAELNLKRAQELIAQRAGSQAELDLAEATVRQARARVASLQATVDRNTVRAPFAGFLGIRQVNLGQYLSPGAPVVSLQELDRVHVDFSLPQQSLQLVNRGMLTRVTTDAAPGEVFQGPLTAWNPDIDVRTRNIKLQATLDNTAGRLRPGMFVRVELILPDPESVIAIPATAVRYAAFGDSVYVVEQGEDGSTVARQRLVRTGRRQGDFVAVLEGLRAGETVVAAGGFKLRNNAPVEVNNEQAPQPSYDPLPAEA
jgi:membrane fusion protein, multidrug efflux system